MSEKLKVAIRNLNVHYGNKQALFDVNLNIKIFLFGFVKEIPHF